MIKFNRVQYNRLNSMLFNKLKIPLFQKGVSGECKQSDINITSLERIRMTSDGAKFLLICHTALIRVLNSYLLKVKNFLFSEPSVL